MSKPTTKSVTLSSAIKIGDKEITEINLREPMGGDLRGLSLFSVSTGDVDQLSLLIPRISDPLVAKEHVQNMSAGNLFKVGEAVSGFFSGLDQ